MNMNPNEKNVSYNLNKQMVFHLYEYEYVPRKNFSKKIFIEILANYF